jgi:hypothetical protein
MFVRCCCLFSLLVVAWPMLATPARSEEPAAEPDLIFILIGQSNMAGRAPLEPGDDAVLESVLLLNQEGRWEPARNPLNRYASHRKALEMQRIGPGEGFVRRLRREFPDKTFGLVVNARGGSKIEEWAEDQPYYLGTRERIVSLPTEKLAGVIWHQGEGNANDPEYSIKLQEFVTRMRSVLKRDDLPFIVGAVFGDKPVNEHLRGISRTIPRTACASAEGLTVFDGVHFDRKSQHLLGTRYAEAWLGVARMR